MYNTEKHEKHHKQMAMKLQDLMRFHWHHVISIMRK